MTDRYKFHHQHHFTNPTLLVSWDEDAGRLGPTICDYLIEKSHAACFCEIEPAPFFSLAGVTVFQDIARFPEIKFYAGARPDLIILKAAPPQFDRYPCLNALLDVARLHCQTKLVVTLSGTIAPLAHTQPRRILAVYNQPQIQQDFRHPDLEDMNWQGPPALNSFLLWTAQKRDIPAVSLWPEIPFYLAAVTDYKAALHTLSFLRKKFTLDLDLHPLEQQSNRQNQKIDELRQDDLAVDQHLSALESQMSLAPEEQMELSQKISRLLNE